jgi:hypothetical protein
MRESDLQTTFAAPGQSVEINSFFLTRSSKSFIFAEVHRNAFFPKALLDVANEHLWINSRALHEKPKPLLLSPFRIQSHI